MVLSHISILLNTSSIMAPLSARKSESSKRSFPSALNPCLYMLANERTYCVCVSRGHAFVGPTSSHKHPDGRAILFQNENGHARHRLSQVPFLQGGEDQGGTRAVHHRESHRDFAHRAQFARRQRPSHRPVCFPLLLPITVACISHASVFRSLIPIQSAAIFMANMYVLGCYYRLDLDH